MLLCLAQAALHPTPAICGRPQEGALAALSAAEPFDRGFYSGPFGWISGAAAEFAVAIRSTLVRGDSSIMQRSASSTPSLAPVSPTGAPVVRAANDDKRQHEDRHDSMSSPAAGSVVQDAAASLPDRQRTVSMYAGVGLVCGSDADKEWQVGTPHTTVSLSELRYYPCLPCTVSMAGGIWNDGWPSRVVVMQELDLKVRPLNRLLRGPPALSEAQNVNMLWAHLMVDELCRLGASTFCIAPGQSVLLWSAPGPP